MKQSIREELEANQINVYKPPSDSEYYETYMVCVVVGCGLPC